MPQIAQELLLAQTVNGLISRVKTPARVLCEEFGTGIGGPNVYVYEQPGTSYTFDIFDKNRRVAKGRTKNAPAATVAAKKIGTNTVSLGKFSEKLPMDINALGRIRELGGTKLDKRAMTYVENQVAQLKAAQENVREAIMASLLRGGTYGFWMQGDDLELTYSANPDIAVDLKVPADFKLTGGSFAAGLQMGTGSNIITASWATASTDIPLQLDAVSAAFESAYGSPLKKVYCNYDVWNNVINNDKVKSMAGTANRSAIFTVTDKGPDGNKIGVKRAFLAGRPDIDWVVVPNTLEIATTNANTFANVQLAPFNHVTFMPEFDTTSPQFRFVEGSEYIKEALDRPIQLVSGFHAWGMEWFDPAAVYYYTMQNGGLEMSIPKSIAWARVQ